MSPEKGLVHLLVPLLFLYCQGQSTPTSELLDAEYMTRGLLAIKTITPTENAVVASNNINFGWSQRIAPYEIEVARDSGFGLPVLKAKITSASYVSRTEDQISGTALTSGYYYWRVKLPILRNNLVSNTSRIFIQYVPLPNSTTPGVIYVNGSTSASTQVGSRDEPYKSIQSGIAAANILRNGDKTIPMAIYVAQGTYTEDLIIPAGISLYGGYSATIRDASGEWTRNISTNTTTVSAVGPRLVRYGSDTTSALRSSSIFDGFTLNGSQSQDTWIFYLSAASPTISNNIFNAASSINGATIAVQVVGGSPIIRSNNMRFTAGGLEVRGILATNTTDLLIEQNNFAITTSVSCHGINLSSASNAQIYNNQIIMRGCGNFETNAIVLSGVAGNIYGNTIYAGTSTGGSGGKYGIYMSSGTSVSILNNIIYAGTDSGTSRFCIFEATAGNNPLAVKNNDLFGCPDGIYRDADGGCSAGNCTLAQMELLNASIYSGNVSIDNTGNQLFIDEDGADNNLNTPQDNDLRIKSSGAPICDVRAGGQNLSALMTDRFGSARTTASPCMPANTNAQGFSMGAHESD